MRYFITLESNMKPLTSTRLTDRRQSFVFHFSLFHFKDFASFGRELVL
jgi:hypothetical protein